MGAPVGVIVGEGRETTETLDEERVRDCLARLAATDEAPVEAEARVVVLVTVTADLTFDSAVEADTSPLVVTVPGTMPPVGPTRGSSVIDKLRTLAVL